MSMLSAQCDKLRQMAESVGLAMPQAATLMMEAADTIWELRCKCADLMSEREEYVWTREFMDRMAKHCGTKDCPSLVSYVDGLEAENAKLRELVRDWRALAVDGADSLSDWIEQQADLENRMRELGVDG